jgi:hypothetical protein
MPLHEGLGVHITTNIGVDMTAETISTKARYLKYLIALGLVLTVAGIGISIRASTTQAAAVHRPEAIEANTMTTCADAGEFFELDVPGTYTAFAMASTGALPTHVRGSHGEVLASTHPTTYNMDVVDVAAGARFGITPPQLFELTSNVMIHVESQDAPYELVIVRLGEEDSEGRIDIRPPVEHVVNESGSCLIGDLRKYSRVHIDAVYSDQNARQVFVVESAAGYVEIDAHAEG